MSDDAGEIITRPPSAPVAVTLLICSILGTILAIAIVWVELFSEYLPGQGPGSPPLDPLMTQHASMKIAEKHVRDHYAVDYGTASDLLAEVEKELGVSSRLGDLAAGAGGRGGGEQPAGGVEAGGGGEAPAGGGEGE